MAKGTFYVHFDDRAAFVDALRAEFGEHVQAAIESAVTGLEPGARRLNAGLVAYLDASLADRTVKALIPEARNGVVAALVERNLKEMGWRESRVAARLVVAMAAEVALLERGSGRKDARARRALRRFIDRADVA